MAKLFAPVWRPYLVLFLGGLAFRLVTALFFRQPGYMDAYYYSNVAESLWRGRGFREDYLFNYLSQPLPTGLLNQPSSVYWMPLTSLLIYGGYLLTGGPSFLASQLPIMLVSSFLPPLTFYLARDIFPDPDERGRRFGWLAGLLMIFCGIYAPYFSLPDNFAPFALFSLLFLMCCYKALRLPPASRRQAHLWLAGAGVCAGLAYLTRVDGVLLLAVPFLLLLLGRAGRQPSGLSLGGLGLMLALFGLTVAPWLARNLADTGLLFPGGGVKTLFWREYNDFFSLNKPLDLAYYLNLSQPSSAWGIGPLLGSKIGALVENLWLIGRGALFLTPLFVVGLFSRPTLERAQASSVSNISSTLKKPISEQALSGGVTAVAEVSNPAKPPRLWRRAEFLPFVLYVGLLYLAMSLAFTFPGTRGSVFHSSGGLLPFIYLISFVGLDTFIDWLGRLSRPRATARRRQSYSLLIVVAFVLVSLGFTFSLRSGWDTDYNQNRAVGEWFQANDPTALALVPDAPAWMYINGRPSLVLTSDSLETNLQLAHRYGANYLLLYPRQAPASFTPLYEHKGAPGFTFVTTIGEIQLYRLDTP